MLAICMANHAYRVDSPPTSKPTAEESETANNCVTPLPSNSIRIAGWAIDWQTTIISAAMDGRDIPSIESTAYPNPFLSLVTHLDVRNDLQDWH